MIASKKKRKNKANKIKKNLKETIVRIKLVCITRFLLEDKVIQQVNKDQKSLKWHKNNKIKQINKKL